MRADTLINNISYNISVRHFWTSSPTSTPTADIIVIDALLIRFSNGDIVTKNIFIIIIMIIIIITHHLNISRSWSSGQACSGCQNHQVLAHYFHPHLLPNCHWDSRFMGCSGDGVNGRDWETDNSGSKWSKWDDVPFHLHRRQYRSHRWRFCPHRQRIRLFLIRRRYHLHRRRFRPHQQRIRLFPWQPHPRRRRLHAHRRWSRPLRIWSRLHLRRSYPHR